MTNNMYTIYVYECEHGKYYVGLTENINRRNKEHSKGEGAEWTKLHKPIQYIETYNTNDKFDEIKITLKYMDKFGIDNVRGGPYCKIVLPSDWIAHIRHVLRSTKDVCYKCHRSGHYARECMYNKDDVCYNCNRYGHYARDCPNHAEPSNIVDDIDTDTLEDVTVIDTSEDESIEIVLDDDDYCPDSDVEDVVNRIMSVSMSQYRVHKSANIVNNVKCFICRRIGHRYSSCHAVNDIEGNVITPEVKNCCRRCGRIGHNAITCDYALDIFSRECYHKANINDIKETVSNVTKDVVGKIGMMGKTAYRWFGF